MKPKQKLLTFFGINRESKPWKVYECTEVEYYRMKYNREILISRMYENLFNIIKRGIGDSNVNHLFGFDIVSEIDKVLKIADYKRFD